LRVKNVIFDLGGVVLDWNPDAILENYFEDPAVRVAMRAAVFDHPDWQRMDRGDFGEAEMVARLQQRTARQPAELAGLLTAVRDSLQPKPDTLALIRRLARRPVPLYCLSNMPASTFAHLRGRYQFWTVFRGIVISGEIKMMKPEREIFEHLLQRYGLAARDTIFIDDLRPNVEAARALGMQAVLFRDARQCEAELEPLLGAR
jgi:putative hydrolase of the HAD superfamily